MQWRAGATLALVALVVLGGLAGPVAAGPVLEPASAGPMVDASGSSAPAAADGPSDPETDVLGWESGYWHNESIAVNQSDGLNETELDAVVARSMARVEHVRQLEFETTVPVEIRSREAFRAEQANRTTDPVLRTFDNAKFEALLLVGEDEDSIGVQNENSGSNVLGFYSPSREAIVVISENPDDLQLEELTLAHELVHALQDQHFNLSRYDARTRDGANAESGLIEGDARLVEHRYRQRCADAGEWSGTCLSPPDGSGDGSGRNLANVGVYVIKIQPYSDGPAFVGSLYADGGWEAVDAVYENPPASTEQVIHSERYLRDAPTNVTLVDQNTDAWARVRPDGRPDYGSLGEAAVFAMLWYPGDHSRTQTQIIPYRSFFNRTDGGVSSFQPYLYDNPYSAGWDGDRLHVYENEANETAYVWQLVWDGPADAREFVDGYLQALSYWGGERVAPNTWVVEDGAFADAFHVAVRGDTVTIVNAPTTRQLPQVREGVEATPTPSPTATRTPTAGTDDNGSHGGSHGATSTGHGEPTSPGQAGFGVLAALAALTIAMLARRRG